MIGKEQFVFLLRKQTRKGVWGWVLAGSWTRSLGTRFLILHLLLCSTLPSGLGGWWVYLGPLGWWRQLFIWIVRQQERSWEQPLCTWLLRVQQAYILLWIQKIPIYTGRTERRSGIPGKPVYAVRVTRAWKRKGGMVTGSRFSHKHSSFPEPDLGSCKNGCKAVPGLLSRSGDFIWNFSKDAAHSTRTCMRAHIHISGVLPLLLWAAAFPTINPDTSRGVVHQMPKVSVSGRWYLQLSSEKSLSVQGRSQLLSLINKCSKLDYKETDQISFLAVWLLYTPLCSIFSAWGFWWPHQLLRLSWTVHFWADWGQAVPFLNFQPFSLLGDRECVSSKLLRQILKNLIKSNKRK